jgi:hypothetical protein
MTILLPASTAAKPSVAATTVARRMGEECYLEAVY